MKPFFLLLAITILTSCMSESVKQNPCTDNYYQFPDTAEVTNNFYDNTETYPLALNKITIEGEIANPGYVDFSRLPKRSVIVKETLLQDDGSDKFIGAYRYDGYSLFDILNDRMPQKVNDSEFGSIIDLFIEIVNEAGEKAVFSWGEIFYPNNLHKIIIATDVSRIVPSRSDDLWDLPSACKIVSGSDLITERNISSPVNIRVRSFPRSFAVERGVSPLNSAYFDLFHAGEHIARITGLQDDPPLVTYNTIFYGRGRGIHSTQPFSGFILRDLLLHYYPVDKEVLREGIMCIAGLDGYRCALSYSEVFNRNDQQEFLLVRYKPGADGGLYRVFATPDFFSDRAIKSVSEIHLNY
ncbi:MAG: hypothetical protein K0B05_10950 [Bacteroidales bacterium]|nr:hypothetical protein [Bacteroidales bacterium]